MSYNPAFRKPVPLRRRIWGNLPTSFKVALALLPLMVAGLVALGGYWWVALLTYVSMLVAGVWLANRPHLKLRARAQKIVGGGAPWVKIRDKGNLVTIAGWPNATDDSVDAKLWDELSAMCAAKLGGQFVPLVKAPERNKGIFRKLPPLVESVAYRHVDTPGHTIALGVTDADTADLVTSDGLPVLLWAYRGGQGAAHMIIAGENGSGKSAELRGIAAQVLNRGGLVAVVDGKRAGDFAYLRGREGVEFVEDATALQCLRGIRKVREIVEKRYDESREMKARGEKLVTRVPLFLILDEFIGLGSEIQDKDDVKQYWSELGIILRKGRAADVHIVMATQRPDVAGGLSGESRDQAGMRIGFGPLGSQGSLMVFNDASVGKLTLPVKGRAAAGRLGGSFARLQGFWLCDPLSDDCSDEEALEVERWLPGRV